MGNRIDRGLRAFVLAAMLLPQVAAAESWSSALVSARRVQDNGTGPATDRPFLSADGRYVAFNSRANNLLVTQHDTNQGSDVFLHDRSTDTLMLVSRALGGNGETAASQDSYVQGISADGRYVLFQSFASNLVAGVTDANAAFDMFLFDRTTGTSELLTHASGSPLTPANGAASSALMTPDARFVAYTSVASNIVAGITDANAQADLFLLDRQGGTTVLVSRPGPAPITANDLTRPPSAITPDGRFIAFSSRATDLLPGVTDTNNEDDVFLYDRTIAQNSLISRSSAFVTYNGSSTPVGLSDDGGVLVFNTTATNVIPAVTDANANVDAYRHDRVAGTTTLVSFAAGVPSNTANGASTAAGVSADGRYVPLTTTATNLAPGVTDANGGSDAYLYDHQSFASVLLSSAAGSTTTAANGTTSVGAFAPGARYLAMVSRATNLVAGTSDANGGNDVYLFDALSGGRQLASHTAASPTTAANGTGFNAAISADGRFVAFLDDGSNFVAGVSDFGDTDAFSYDRDSLSIAWLSRARGTVGSATGTSIPARLPQLASPTAVSDDGRFVLFSTTASDVLAGVNDTNGGGNDAYLHDRIAGTQTLVSRVNGSPVTSTQGTALALGADGRYALFSSSATNVVAGSVDVNGQPDLYLFDRTTGVTRLVSGVSGSPTTTINGRPDAVALSADGRFVVFETNADNVVAGGVDPLGVTDVYLFDRVSGSTVLVTHTVGSLTTSVNGNSTGVAISPDGRFVLFHSVATNLVSGQTDTNAGSDAFVYDGSTGTVQLLSHTSAVPPLTTGNGTTVPVAISDNGTWVLLQTNATDLAAGITDTNGGRDTYLVNRVTNARALVSHASGSATSTGNGVAAADAKLSADGGTVAYATDATNVLPGSTDVNGAPDLYLYDRVTAGTTLASRALGSATTTANASADVRSISADGSRVLYLSAATNVIAGGVDANLSPELFVFERTSGTSSLVSHAAGLVRTASASGANTGALTPDGQWVVYRSASGDLVDIDNNVMSDVFLAGRRVSVTPVANTGGTLSPGATVEVVPGQSAAFGVSALPDYALQSITGCSGSLAAGTYTTAPVVEDCTVTAQFGNGPPVVTLEASRSVLEDSGVTNVAFGVSDLESAESALTAGASAAPGGLLSGVSVGAGASDAERVLSFATVADASGAASVTVVVNDPLGASGMASLMVTVTPVNDAPTLALGSVAVHPAGSSGARGVPAFATFGAGPADEVATQAVDDYLVDSVDDPGAILAVGSLDIANDGTLTYTLTGASGTATVTVRVRDNGGVANGGVDTSAVAMFTVSVAPVVIFLDGFESP